MDGIINVLKPPGMTSHDVVAYLRRQLQERKIGHTGTLDPQAAGVLPVCVGKGTRLVDYLTLADKDYLCRMTLGLTTTTQDIWGEPLAEQDSSSITLAEIESALPRFRGVITQQVPVYSAVKTDGVPLYKRARRGETIEPVLRRVEIQELRLLDYRPPHVTFFIKCSKGTYIRTVCHDLGQTLRVGGCMSFLLRTRVGDFRLDDAFTLEEIAEKKDGTLLPLSQCLGSINKVLLPAEQLRRVVHGQKIDVSPDALEYGDQQQVALVDKRGNLYALALVSYEEDRVYLKPKKVFNVE